MIKNELNWAPFISLLKKELKRFWRVIGQTIFIPLINSTLYMMIFGVSLGNIITVEGHRSYLAFLIPGIVMMGILNNAFQNSSSSIGTSRFHGDLEDLRVVPLSPLQIDIAYMLGGLVRGILVGIVTFTVGQAFYLLRYNEFLGIAHPIALLLVLLCGGLSFSALGVSVAFWAKNFDQLSAIGGFVLLPLMYLGGVFFPLSSLHPFWQTLSKFNPMIYFINGVRYGILGNADLSIQTSLSISFLTLAILFLISLKIVKNGKYQRW